MGRGSEGASPTLSTLTVVRNDSLCTDHLRLTALTDDFRDARPGQFLHIGPAGSSSGCSGEGRPPVLPVGTAVPVPFLRRAFSIGGLRRTDDGAEIDLVYRVLGAGTRWLATLRPDDRIDAIGPLGNAFPWPDSGKTAWLVAGGVGLPPLQWFARELAAHQPAPVLFLGARTSGLLPLPVRVQEGRVISDDLPHTELVLATDDGSLGYHGDIVAALADHADRLSSDAGRAVVYTCGPEVMMRAVARFCAARSVPCYACMERSMACGIGTCQSCVLPVADASDPEGWQYALCCSQGPVFDATRVIWEP
jgi:dihydroorotate dehydrogenase electron transfer subunit